MKLPPTKTNQRGVLETVLWQVMPLSCLALLGIWLLVAAGGEWLLKKRSIEYLEATAQQQTWIVVEKVEGLMERLRDVANNALTINAFLDPVSVEHFIEPFFSSLRFGAFESPVVKMVDFTGQVVASNDAAKLTDDDSFEKDMLNRVVDGHETIMIVGGSLVAAVPIHVGSLPEGGIFIKLSEADTRILLSSKDAGTLVWLQNASQSTLHGMAQDEIEARKADGMVISERIALPSFPSLSLVSAVPNTDNDGLVDILHGFLFFAFFADLAALLVAIYMAASLVARPLNGLVGKIQSFQGLTGPEARLATEGPAEIANLAHAFNDATERQTELTERLEKSLANEQKLNNLQRQFVSLVSHEFRTPLAVIDGNAQRVLRKVDTMPRDRITGALEKTRTAVAKLIALMETVLSSSKIDAGTIEFNPEPCPLLEILEESIENQHEVSKNHCIIASIGQLNPTIIADKKLVHHIFANLLSNAVKYSPNADRVWVDGHREGEWVVISFRDEGVGIPKEQIEKLFSQFFRASTAKGIAGTGIGLNLVKKLVELHGGSVAVESVEGVGSTFRVKLPIGGPKGRLVEDAPTTDLLESAVA